MRVNNGTDANMLTDLLTFMSNAILNSAIKYLGCGNLENSVYQGGTSEQRSWMPYTGLQWATGIFLRDNVDQLRSQSMLSKLQRGECNDFSKEIKPLYPKKKSFSLTVWGTSGESNIANPWKDHFSAIADSVGSTDNRDQVVNALRTVPDYNDVNNINELRQIVKGVKTNKAVGNDGIPSEEDPMMKKNYLHERKTC